MLTIWVVVMTGDQSEEGKISMSNFVARNVSASVSKMGVDFLEEVLQESDASVNLLRSRCVIDDSKTSWLLNNVVTCGVEPLRLILLLGVLWHVSMIMSNHLQDGHALQEDLSIISDVDGHLGTFTVCSSLLNCTPLWSSQTLVFKGDTFYIEHVAYGLGASLDVEIQ